jgi:NADH-quinone oxidoreductase subunit L
LVGTEGIINFSIRFDEYTFGMYLVVLTVSFLVHIYSIVYMYADPFLARFLSYLTLFTLFMLILVSADNFVVLFLG